jgi:hypothetical protein
VNRWNLYSQNGEDGVLAEIFASVGTRNRWCCELGAWDGKLFSNTRHLIENGWAAVLFECERDRFRELLANTSAGMTVYAENALVESLDESLAEYPIPQDFDLLSIDVDGKDYRLWHDLGDYEPRVVVIEVNSSKPVSSTDQFDDERGTAIRPMVELGQHKGYTLVAHTGNAIFVRNDLATDEQREADWRMLFDTSWVTE